MFFMCKQCGEATMYERTSKRPGVCRDCYIIGDMDRFIPVDTPQESPEDRLHDPDTSEAAASQQEEQKHTTPSPYHLWHCPGEALEGMEDPEHPIRVPGDNYKWVLGLLQSQSSADTEDK